MSDALTADAINDLVSKKLTEELARRDEIAGKEAQEAMKEIDELISSAPSYDDANSDFIEDQYSKNSRKDSPEITSIIQEFASRLINDGEPLETVIAEAVEAGRDMTREEMRKEIGGVKDGISRSRFLSGITERLGSMTPEEGDRVLKEAEDFWQKNPNLQGDADMVYDIAVKKAIPDRSRRNEISEASDDQITGYYSASHPSGKRTVLSDFEKEVAKDHGFTESEFREQKEKIEAMKGGTTNA